jgi:tRNA G46 methylase TrmB
VSDFGVIGTEIQRPAARELLRQHRNETLENMRIEAANIMAFRVVAERRQHISSTLMQR